MKRIAFFGILVIATIFPSSLASAQQQPKQEAKITVFSMKEATILLNAWVKARTPYSVKDRPAQMAKWRKAIPENPPKSLAAWQKAWSDAYMANVAKNKSNRLLVPYAASLVPSVVGQSARAITHLTPTMIAKWLASAKEGSCIILKIFGVEVAELCIRAS